jgi:hypothetical protein
MALRKARCPFRTLRQPAGSCNHRRDAGLVEELVDKITKVESALDSHVGGNHGPLLRTVIDNAAPSAGYTQFIDSARDLILGATGPNPLGLIGEVAAMYCDFVADLTLLQKSRDLVTTTTLVTLNKALADTLLQYEHDFFVLIDNAVCTYFDY